MFRIIAVSSRPLCRGDFLSQIEAVAASGVWGLMLREKNLAEEEYTALARQTAAFCARYGTVFIVHRFSGAARALGGGWIQLPFPAFLRFREAGADINGFTLGVSVHSAEEARYAAS
jgi:thiamine-phosphate pyrophosphorylase